MNIQQEQILTLLKNCILEQQSPVFLSSFDGVETISLDHFCMPFIYQGAINAGLNPPEEWRDMLFFRLGKNLHNVKIQQQLISILEENKIPCAVLKGTSIAICYPEPSLRALGDIDILVAEENYQKAIELLSPYMDSLENIENHEFHCQFLVNGTPVEIHKAITRDSFHSNHKEIMKNALCHLEHKTYEGVSFPLLSPAYQAASIILHIHRHFLKMEVNLRLLCDWAVFVKTTPIAIWENEILPVFEKLKLTLFANTLVGVCNKYLDIGCESKLTASVPDELCEAVLLEFFHGGAAIKSKTTAQGIGNAYAKNKQRYKNPVRAIIKTLNDNSRGKYRKASRLTILLPVLWALLIVQYLLRVLIGKREKLSAKEFASSYQRHAYIYEAMQLDGLSMDQENQ